MDVHSLIQDLMLVSAVSVDALIAGLFLRSRKDQDSGVFRVYYKLYMLAYSNCFNNTFLSSRRNDTR